MTQLKLGDWFKTSGQSIKDIYKLYLLNGSRSSKLTPNVIEAVLADDEFTQFIFELFSKAISDERNPNHYNELVLSDGNCFIGDTLAEAEESLIEHFVENESSQDWYLDEKRSITEYEKDSQLEARLKARIEEERGTALIMAANEDELIQDYNNNLL